MREFSAAAVAKAIEALTTAKFLIATPGATDVAVNAALTAVCDEIKRRANINFHVPPSQQGEQMLEQMRPVAAGQLERAAKHVSWMPVDPRHSIKLKRIVDEVRTSRVLNADSIRTRIMDLTDDLIADLNESTCLHLHGTDRTLFRQPLPVCGEQVARRFPEASFDLAAAARCLSLNEWTASVFHSMRAIEHGLKALAAVLSVPTQDQTWGKILEGIEARIGAMRATRKRAEEHPMPLQMVSEVAAEIQHFRNAWRDHVSHARANYDEETGRRVWQHCRSFMALLSTALPEQSE